MNNIDKIRLKKRLSYGVIAKEAELTPTYIHLLAKNKRTNPSLDTMKKISLALGEKVGTVFPTN